MQDFDDRQGIRFIERNKCLKNLQSFEKNEQLLDPKIDIREIYKIQKKENVFVNELNLKMPERSITRDDTNGPLKAILYRGGEGIQVKREGNLNSAMLCTKEQQSKSVNISKFL